MEGEIFYIRLLIWSGNASLEHWNSIFDSLQPISLSLAVRKLLYLLINIYFRQNSVVAENLLLSLINFCVLRNGSKWLWFWLSRYDNEKDHNLLIMDLLGPSHEPIQL
ncbi:unnamed protein product [Brugia timori]|uniref:Ovule protein n=1 Tax=Brugia timori TaxID=42155 RepID=A0A0R3QVY7_9BILA|nr:unnamed protein product [Brugia timori]